MCASDLSLDDSGGFDQIDDGHSLSGVDLQDINHSHNNLSLQGLDSTSPHPLLTSHTDILPTPSYHPINPIDKLYLMQNAYFRLDQ